MIIFFDFKDPIFISRDPKRVPKTLLKNPGINFDGSSANVTLFSSEKWLMFWKVVVGCG